MSHKIYTLLLLMLLVSCNKEEKTLQSKTEIEKKTFCSPLFLGLSPKMTDAEFSTEINKLNSIGKLEKNLFYLVVQDEEYPFSVNKKKTSIELKYYKDTTLKYTIDPKFDYQKYIKYNAIYDLKRNKIITIFKNKYKLNDIQLPTNIDLKPFNLPLKNYLLFKDDEKYILLGYEIISSENPMKFDNKNEKNIDKQDLTVPIMYAREDFLFGLKLSVNYYPIEDFKVLLEEILATSNNKKELEKSVVKQQQEKIENIDQI